MGERNGNEDLKRTFERHPFISLVSHPIHRLKRTASKFFNGILLKVLFKRDVRNQIPIVGYGVVLQRGITSRHFGTFKNKYYWRVIRIHIV